MALPSRSRTWPARRSSLVFVGCDGAHSADRHLLNVPFEGAETDDTFLLAAFQLPDEPSADELQLCPSELGPVAIFPMSATRRRVVAVIERMESDAPSLDLVRKVSPNTPQLVSERARCTGVATSVSITARLRNCVSAACSSPAIPLTSTVPSVARG